MSRATHLGLVVGLLAAMAGRPGRAHGAPCATACKDEIAACVSAECEGLVKRPLKRCRHQCKKSIVHDCYADLSLCGATTARPPVGGGSYGSGW